MSQQLQQTQSSIPTLYTAYVYTVEAQDCIRQLLQCRTHPKSISLYLQRYLLYTYAISLSIQMIYSTCRNTLCNGNCSHLSHKEHATYTLELGTQSHCMRVKTTMQYICPCNKLAKERVPEKQLEAIVKSIALIS